jgi:hypothetical protein
MSRTQETAAIEEVPGNREAARRAGTALQLARICRWTLFDPIRVRRLVVATGSGRTVRWAWCGLAAGFGALLSPLAGATDLPGALVLPAIAALLALIASIDLHSEGVDALGIMCLSILLFVFAMPATMPTSRPASPGPWFWAAALPLFAMGLGFGGKISQAAMNRGFLFLPVGLAMISMAAAASPSGSLLGRLGSLAGAEPGRLEAACLLLALSAVRLAGPQASIGSFTPMAGTETCHAIPVTACRRVLVLAYLSFSAGFLLLHLIRPSPRMALLAGALLAGAVLEMDLPAHLRLSLWLRRQDGALGMAAREPLIFAFPVLAFQPAGVGSWLRRVREMEGSEVAGELAVDLFLRTGYRRAAERMLQEIGTGEPFLFHRLRRRLAAEVPRDPREQQDAARAAPARAAATARATAPLVAPALSVITVEGLSSPELQGLLFSHLYEPPRGEEGAPLAALPIWFPVAAPPTETLTFAQVLYRSLGSVRKPFRRTRLLVPDEARVRSMYTELLEWAADWAESSLGASLVPVALSLRRLAGNGRSLEALAQRLSRERLAAQAGSGPQPDSGCREILELGMSLAGAELEELPARIEAGNAWILLEDDRSGDENLKPVKQALDAVFGAAGLLDAAIIVLSARQDCEVLSDVQTFSEAKPREEKEPGEPRATEPPESVVRPWTPRLCRALARLGSPGGRAVLRAVTVLGLGFLALVLLRYEDLLRLSSYFSPQESPLGFLAAYIFAGAALIAPMAAGYAWGLSYGSEEVRRASVDESILSMLAFFSLFLLLLPRGMDPGPWKTACIALTALPASALVPLAMLGALSQAGNVLWLLLSVRISQRLGAGGLAMLAERFQPVLHVAHFSAELPLPHGRDARSRLPLLVAVANRKILTGLLPFFPSLAQQLRTVVLTGIRKDSEPYSVAAASLILEALADQEDDECQSCLRHLASGCTAAWPQRDEFDVYREPSTTFRMNALEYVARRLCYLTNLEELIVVR